MRFSLAKHLLKLLCCVDADDQLVGVQHVIGIHAASEGGLDTGNVASALDELCIDSLIDQQVLLASADGVQHGDNSLGLVLVAGELINNDHVAIGSLVGQDAQQSQALDLVVDVVVVAAGLGAQSDAAVSPLRCTDGTLTSVAGALPNILCTAL